MTAISLRPAPRLHLCRPMRQVFRILGRWMERRRQRLALAKLEDWQLEDIGVSRAEAEREIAKPFWR